MRFWVHVEVNFAALAEVAGFITAHGDDPQQRKSENRADVEQIPRYQFTENLFHRLQFFTVTAKIAQLLSMKSPCPFFSRSNARRSRKPCRRVRGAAARFRDQNLEGCRFGKHSVPKLFFAMAALPAKATQHDRERSEKQATPRRRQPVWCTGWKNTGRSTAFALRTIAAGSSYTHLQHPPQKHRSSI
jgi:hypothetical protein